MKGLAGLLLLALAANVAVGAESEEIQQLFQSKCAKCHGSDGVPKRIAKEAPTLSDPNWQSSVTIDDLMKSISEGKGKKMPKFRSKLTPEEIRALAAFIKSLKKTS